MIKGAIVFVALATAMFGGNTVPASAASAVPSADGILLAQAATPAQRPKKAAPAKAPDAPAAPAGVQGATAGWVTRCIAKTRNDPLDCVIEQSVLVAKTGQLVALMRIQVPSATRAPVMLVQLPLGLNIPVGISLQIDDAPKTTLAIQTCDVQGCYVGSPIQPETIDALTSGKNLKIVFQNQDKQDVTVTLQLANFAAGYAAIK